MSATPTSGSPKNDLPLDAKMNPFIQWIPPDLLQPIQKFLTRGPFCDPYQQHQDEEESDSESDDDHDTTTAAAIVESNDVIATKSDSDERFMEDPCHIATTDDISQEDESNESTTSVDPTLPESTEQREVIPIQDSPATISNDDEEEEEEEQVELQLSPDGVEISVDDHQLRSRSFSDTASPQIVDGKVEGTSPETTLDGLGQGDVTNETPTSPVVDLSNHSKLPTPCSEARTIVKFIVFWVGLLFVSVILQPGSIYDSKWFLDRFQHTKTTIQSQLEDCKVYFAGKTATDCIVETFHNTMKIQVASCHAYVQGESDTSCLVQVAGKAIAKQSTIVGNTLQDSFQSIQNILTLEFSKCRSFLQHLEPPTGCILESPYKLVHRSQEWIRMQVHNLWQYVHEQGQACQAYLTLGEEKTSPTGCFLEDVVGEWNNFQRLTHAQLETMQQQLTRQSVECQQFLTGRTATDCILETAQQMLCELLERMTTKISDQPTRIRRVEPTATDEMEGVKSLESETIPPPPPPEVVTPSTSDQPQNDISDPLDNVSTTLEPSSTEVPTESLQNGNIERNDVRQEKEKQFDLSYFDHLEPIPEDQIPPRSAFKGEKKRASQDPVQSPQNDEPVVHHHDSTKEADTNHVEEETIEHNPTMSNTTIQNDELTGADQGKGDNENPSQNESPKEIPSGVDETDEIIEDTSTAKDSNSDDSSNPLSSATTTTAATISPVVESSDESETWIDTTDHAIMERTETTTNTMGDGNRLGEMDFVKLEYDADGIPYLVKGVKTMDLERDFESWHADQCKGFCR